jgi:hypothetical protein
MSLISQLFRQLTKTDCPPEIETELIDYIKTFNGNAKIHKLLNIFNNTIADDEYVKCMKMKLPELKQYSKLYVNNRIRVSTFSSSGSTGGVIKRDYAYSCSYTKIFNYIEEKAKELMCDIMFNQDRFYDYQQDKVISIQEKQEIMVECITPLLEEKTNEIIKSYGRYKDMWKKHNICVGRGLDGDIKQELKDKFDMKLEYWDKDKINVELLISRLQQYYMGQMKVLRSRFKKLSLNRARKSDSMCHSLISSFSHYHKSTAEPICYFEINLLNDNISRKTSMKCIKTMYDIVSFNYDERYDCERRYQYIK